MMKKPDWTRYLRPDEVAECWDGVTKVPGLYEALWGFMKAVRPIPNREDTGPADHIGYGNLAQFWDQLSPEHQAALIEIDDRRQRQKEEYLKTVGDYRRD